MMRQGPTRRSFLAALVAALFGWLGMRPPQARAVSPSLPPPLPALPHSDEGHTGQIAASFSYDGAQSLLPCCDPAGRCMTFVYDGKARLG